MEKQRWEESEKRRAEEKVRRKKMQVSKKVEKPPFIAFFAMLCSTRGSKRRLAKAAGAKPSGR